MQTNLSQADGQCLPGQFPPQSDQPSGWIVARRKAVAFFHEVERQYKRSNPYHNNTHAADVLQTAAIILSGGPGCADVSAASGCCPLVANGGL
jgi:hypothetical protein